MGILYKVKRVEGHSYIDDLIRDNDILLDLGVFDGSFGRVAASKKKLQIFGLEADPNYYKKYNLENNPDYINSAIGSANGKIKLKTREGESSSIHELSENQGPEFTISQVDYKWCETHWRISTLALIKFDIEGAEIDVIDSCSDIQIRNWNQITIEFHDFLFPQLETDVNRIRNRIKELGFLELSFSRNHSDILFINKKLDYVRWRLLCSYFFYKYFRGIKRMLKRLLSTAT